LPSHGRAEQGTQAGEVKEKQAGNYGRAGKSKTGKHEGQCRQGSSVRKIKADKPNKAGRQAKQGRQAEPGTHSSAGRQCRVGT
jgi:hypothetical protein